MKLKKIQHLKKGILILTTWTFFGLFYPQICVTEDTCKVIYEAGDGEWEETTVLKGSELYYKLLSAEPEEITIKSRFWEYLCSYFKKDKEK